MRFWDTSALVPLIIQEGATEIVDALLESDPEMVLWWGSSIECSSALARTTREGLLSREDSRTCLGLLGALRDSAHEILPGEDVRSRSTRLLFLHPLRAADALQLAAALMWRREKTQGAEFVCLDVRLREAAEREGFTVLPPTLPS